MGSKLLNGSPQLSVMVTLFKTKLMVLLTNAKLAGTPVIKEKQGSTMLPVISKVSNILYICIYIYIYH